MGQIEGFQVCQGRQPGNLLDQIIAQIKCVQENNRVQVFNDRNAILLHKSSNKQEIIKKEKLIKIIIR